MASPDCLSLTRCLDPGPSRQVAGFVGRVLVVVVVVVVGLEALAGAEFQVCRQRSEFGRL
ncbi:hypothetical protein SODALDRAFT_331758 [Sodiomyces alkalinus F11]|uniref:Uncharacterized protein n=1 Tax=Sodiomyces alkalinus (strain CBS 110278 / VKM F-3762 / F11) TaxID=1314773 RepID=A0A3N2PYZ4_SODAK|nr:hypothetical protein SODALDRAFT_331758 [Sodiomyces alkalinus F11]ROT39648.1 hypothetical protein SODALDRAFT_331758 [Sodiomyces alkalinus F11]